MSPTELSSDLQPLFETIVREVRFVAEKNV
jgi:hypothetical protein